MHCRIRLQRFQPNIILHRGCASPVSKAKHVRCCASDSSGTATTLPVSLSRACELWQYNGVGSIRRFAVIGGGFAGVAAAHYLAASALITQPTVVHLYDIAGLVRHTNDEHTQPP